VTAAGHDEPAPVRRLHTLAPRAPAALPPADLPGLDPSWSRLVTAPDADGHERTWHVLDRGEAVHGTLVCVHGNPTWSYLWRDLIAQAPSGWRIIAVDQLEMGFSERTGVHRGLERRIDDLGRLTAALGVDGPVVAVGHDWGGPVSLGWALAHRAQLRGVVLTNTAVHQPDDQAVPGLIRAARGRGVLEQVCTTTPTFIDGALALARPRLPADIRTAYKAPYPNGASRHGIAGFVRDIPIEDGHPAAAPLDAIARDLGALADVPALLVWGPSDPVFADRYLHDLERRLPHADVERVIGSSHLVVEDVDLAGIVGDWLAVRVGPTPVDRASIASTGGARRAARPDDDDDGASTRQPLWAALADPARAERVAVLEPTGGSDARRRTFGDLHDDVEALTHGLLDAGVTPGARIALLIPPGVELATVLYACWRLGAVPVLADAGLGARGITSALQAAAPEHLVGIPRALAAARALRWPGTRIATADTPTAIRRATSTSLGIDELLPTGREARSRGDDAPAVPHPDSDAAIAFTSGATGPSKGVVYTHRRLEAQREALRATYRITDDDRLVAAFAPFALYGPALGITSIVPDMDVTAPGSLTASALAAAVTAVDATMVFASPAALRNVVATGAQVADDHRPALKGVRLLLSAGAPVPAELLAAAGELFPDAEPHTPYGMTEALPVADIALTDIVAAGVGNGVCVGRPIDGVEVVVAPLDEHGRPTGDHTTAAEVTGELLVRAAHTKDRYDRRWVAQLASSRDVSWHRTGDVGHLDADGRLWVEGRLAHVITTADGVRTPVGIERAVETEVQHLHSAAAVGVGPVGNQQLVVVVATDPPAPRAQLAPTSLVDAVRRAIDTPVAAVLVAKALPVDIRHQSKIDRARLATWAAEILAGGRIGEP
jgi:olefin beta-lactone synthetase